MFWDLVSKYYTFFEKLYNGRVNREMCKKVAERIASDDEMLECACGIAIIRKQDKLEYADKSRYIHK